VSAAKKHLIVMSLRFMIGAIGVPTILRLCLWYWSSGIRTAKRFKAGGIFGRIELWCGRDPALTVIPLRSCMDRRAPTRPAQAIRGIIEPVNGFRWCRSDWKCVSSTDRKSRPSRRSTFPQALPLQFQLTFGKAVMNRFFIPAIEA